jgi:hypothetical protein
MTASNLSLLLAGIALALLLWSCVFFAVPNALRALFRHRLWRLRDEVIDKAIAGELEPSEARQFAREVENTIEAATELTPARLVWFYVAGGRKAALSDRPKHSEAMHPYAIELGRQLFIQLFTGSPSGWLFLPIFLVVYRIVEARVRERPHGAKPPRLEQSLERSLYAAETWTTHYQRRRSRRRDEVLV